MQRKGATKARSCRGDDGVGRRPSVAQEGRRAILVGLAITSAGVFQAGRRAAILLQSLGDPQFYERLARNTELLRLHVLSLRFGPIDEIAHVLARVELLIEFMCFHSSISFLRAWRIEIIRMFSPRYVQTAVQYCPLIFPITKKRGSSSLRVGASSIQGSSHSSYASSKSMPCLTLFATLLAGSCSKIMKLYGIEIISFQSRAC